MERTPARTCIFQRAWDGRDEARCAPDHQKKVEAEIRLTMAHPNHASNNDLLRSDGRILDVHSSVLLASYDRALLTRFAFT
jgi:hypothetical protein